MKYCVRCLYPENSKPAIILDDEGVCSGCRYHESRQRIDWGKREEMLRKILAIHKQKAKEDGDRKSVVQGKSVDLGGRRIIKKKT